MTHCLRAVVEAGHAEAAAGLMHLAGASGVEVRDGEGLLPPGAAPLPTGRAELLGYYERQGDAAAARRWIEDRLGGRGEIEEVVEEPWAESWKKHFRPLVIGRLYVVPPWAEEATPAGCERIVLEPGMAFGTGSHATTALCLAALDELLRARPAASVLDVGTGSGILAIAAAKLGGVACGSDDDPLALRVAREKAGRNEGAFVLVPAGQEPARRHDIVVANILANTLVSLAPSLQNWVAPGGRLLLSGLLVSQADEVAAAFAPLHELPRRREGDWMLLEFEQGRT